MPKKTINRIVKKNGDYIVGVKGNQKNLLKNIIEITKDKSAKIETMVTEKSSRGRNEKRIYELYKNSKEELKEAWIDLEKIIKVERIREIKNKKSVEIVYFITNKDCELSELATGIRNHWLIENSLHWVKDVIFEEDKTRHKLNEIPEIKSILINIVINILRENEDKYLKRTMRLCSNDIQRLWSFLE